MDKDIIWFAENICGLKLNQDQKDILVQVQNAKDNGQKVFLSLGRYHSVGLLDRTLRAFKEWCKDQRISDLEAKLADKEKDLEIKELQVKNLTENCSYAMFCSIVKQKIELEEQLRLAKMGESFEQEKKNNALQSQNQTAIAELEQLKHDIWTNQQDDGWLDEKVDIYELTEMIDQQIKELRGNHG